MRSRPSSHSAWILHVRPFRDTSLLVELLTRELGRVSALMRGARRPRKGQPRLQPLAPLLVSWSGNGELKTLVAVEEIGAPLRCGGRPLLSVLYVNELVYRLMQPFDSHPALFDGYGELLYELAAAGDNWQVALRRFEFLLLRETGYGLDFIREAGGASHIAAEREYRLDFGSGFVPVYDGGDGGGYAGAGGRYSGAALLAMAAGRYGENMAVRQAARQLVREVLDQLPGLRKLGSRKLFSTRAQL